MDINGNEPEIDTKLDNQNQVTVTNNKDALAKKEKLTCPAIPNIWCIIIHLVSISMIVVGAIYFDEKQCPAEKISLLLIIGGVLILLESIVLQLDFRCSPRPQVKPSNVKSRKKKELRTETTETTMATSGQVIKVFTTIVQVEQPEETPETGTSLATCENGNNGCSFVRQRVSPGIFVLRCLAMILAFAFLCVFFATCAVVFRLYNRNVEYGKKGDTNKYCNPGLFLFAFIYLLMIFSILILLILIFIITFICYCFYSTYMQMERDDRENREKKASNSN